MKGEGEELNNDEGNLDDHAKRLLELYDRKYRSFENYFSILVGISISVFFFLLFPFVSSQDMKHKVIENITQTNNTISHIRNLYNGISMLKDAI
jgi:hypothetical protein